MAQLGIKIDSRAGRDNNIYIFLPASSAPPEQTVESFRPVLGAVPPRASTLGGRTPYPATDDQRELSETDKSLTREIDAYRNMLEDGSARRASVAFEALLSALPHGASDYVVFRVKANIGHCHMQLGEKQEALRWLDDAVAAAPADPRAIALKAYAMLVRGEVAEAFAFATDELVRSPDNENIAAHAIDAAILLNDGTDPEPSIPVAMRERERVLIARCILRRQRDERPAWWNIAKLGTQRFPANKTLKLFATEAEVDEIAHSARGETHRRITNEEKARLRLAAIYLEERWRRVKTSEVPTREDGLEALSTAMIARALLDEHAAAIAHARDLIGLTSDDGVLLMAAQIANTIGDDDVAEAALAKLPDEGPAAFLKGITAASHNAWEAAAGFFTRAAVPERERRFVEMIIQLGGIDGMDDGAAREALEQATRTFGDDPRALIVLSGLAERKRLPDIATNAYRGATTLIGPEMHHPARIMIAAHAYRSDDFETIIRVLDGHVDLGVWSKELQWLADAHASEHPPRPRNLRFFEGLPKNVRQIATIARGHASKLLDLKRETEAEPILRRIVEEVPTDVFARLKYLDVLLRTGRSDEAKAIVREADELAMKGPSTYRLRWAHQLRDAGEPQRAIAYALALLRSHIDDPKIALGYVALVFADKSETIIPHADAVAPETWVAIESSAGDRDAFLIDDGPSLLGIDVVPASHARAQRVLGLRLGQTVEAPSIAGQAITWTVKEVKSKALAVLHTIMQTFEQRFPTAKGLWRVSIAGSDVQPVLDVIREQAKAKRESTERLYVEGQLPLAFAARAVGADVLSFANYLRTMGFEIVTTSGAPVDYRAGLKVVHDYKTVGATLDAYTAITAAEMNTVDVLAGWYGKLAVPASTIETIEALIAHARSSIGTEGMSVGWKDGAFYREDVDDEILTRQIGQLEAIKQKIEECCEIVAAVVPDDLASEVAQFVRTTGRADMDAMYIAAARGDVLVSEDLYYRQLAASLAKVDGTWLQASLLVAHSEDRIDRSTYAKACAQLGYRRHGNLWVDDGSLAMMSEECTPSEFAAICHYIGTRNALIWSHLLLVSKFLRRIWDEPAAHLKREGLTSTIVSSLLRYRSDDWHYCLALLWIMAGAGDPDLRSYLASWISGHFLPAEAIIAAERRWRIFLRQNAPSSLASISSRALHAGTIPDGPIELGVRPARQTRLDTKPDNDSGPSKKGKGKRARRRKSR